MYYSYLAEYIVIQFLKIFLKRKKKKKIKIHLDDLN